MVVKKSLSEEINSLEFGESLTFSLKDLMKKKSEDDNQPKSENKSNPGDDLSPYNTVNS